MNETKWKVGDPVVVRVNEPHTRHRHTHDGPELQYGTVSKVARKYFTVDGLTGRYHPHSFQFDIATGRQRPENPDYTNYLDYAYTPAEWEEVQLRRRLIRQIEEHGIRPGGRSEYSNWRDWETIHLVELAAVLDRRTADMAKTNLDAVPDTAQKGAQK